MMGGVGFPINWVSGEPNNAPPGDENYAECYGSAGPDPGKWNDARDTFPLQFGVIERDTPYDTPADNPFADGANGLPEIYAYGLRNPFKFSFDDGPGGDGTLWLPDVGQNLYEEINIGANGANYGWVIREAAHLLRPV
jgi:glucose/arabinose dehydrogenase